MSEFMIFHRQNNIKNEYIISSTLLIFGVLLVRCLLDLTN